MEVTAGTPCWAALCDPDPSPHCAVLCLVLASHRKTLRSSSGQSHSASFSLQQQQQQQQRGEPRLGGQKPMLPFFPAEAHMGQVWALHWGTKESKVLTAAHREDRDGLGRTGH